jgi:hypothetical protein
MNGVFNHCNEAFTVFLTASSELIKPSKDIVEAQVLYGVMPDGDYFFTHSFKVSSLNQQICQPVQSQ